MLWLLLFLVKMLATDFWFLAGIMVLVLKKSVFNSWCMFGIVYICIYIVYIYIYEEKIKKIKNLVFYCRKISYFVFIYIFPLVLLLISSFEIHNLKLARWFLLTLKH